VQLPIIIGLHRSSLLRGVFLLVALAAMAAILLLPSPFPWRMCGLLLLAPLLLRAWGGLHAMPRRLRLERDGSVSLCQAGDDDFRQAVCLPGATVHPALCVFRLREAASGNTHVVLVTGDSTSADEFRRLRVFLRWRAVFSCSPSATE
jgi:toxin CptA